MEYVFVFTDAGDLIAPRGQRGDFIFYSPADYVVAESRRLGSGEGREVAGSTPGRER
jgi:hypothetical protein